ncbi:hypothetical protein VTP01DRAFT_7678 [Rhizomucor pusillus]|uniref:uncharacterized protein n=1 Tax=Rhizomucor pusillus TaxID=4840 RepID=UPI0037427EE5
MQTASCFKANDSYDNEKKKGSPGLPALSCEANFACKGTITGTTRRTLLDLNQTPPVLKAGALPIKL